MFNIEEAPTTKNRQEFKYICAFKRSDYAVVEDKNNHLIFKQLS